VTFVNEKEHCGTIIVVGILLLMAYFYDRKHTPTYEDDDGA
jgi:hypothetical protein